MTEFYQIVSMSRPFRTLDSRVIQDPILRNPSVSCMGLLRFSIFDAVGNQSYTKLEPCCLRLIFERISWGVKDLLQHTIHQGNGI